MLLNRQPRGGHVSKEKLRKRFQLFSEGRWADLMGDSEQIAEAASSATHRKKRRRNTDDSERRAARALTLVQLGEFSTRRVALEVSDLAPGSEGDRHHARFSHPWDGQSRPSGPGSSTEAAHLSRIRGSRTSALGGVGRRGRRALVRGSPRFRQSTRQVQGQVGASCSGWAGRKAWQHCWASLLACASARAFALSLLDRRPVVGSDGVVPCTSAVITACRHLPPSEF